PKSCKGRAACCMISQSFELPIKMAISGLLMCLLFCDIFYVFIAFAILFLRVCRILLHQIDCIEVPDDLRNRIDLQQLYDI
ncbi:MAG: hypothetical protein WAT12_07640, partial [Candidatus Nitrotoga sp.]